MSKRSLARLALLVRGCGLEFRSLMTLTYGANYPLSGKKAKSDLNHFLIASKREFGHYEYVWVLEFQERGAVHFHIATTLPEPDILARSIFSRLWTKISTPYSWRYSKLKEENGKLFFDGDLLTDIAVTSQHIKDEHWERVRNEDSLHRYFTKYTMKIRQKKVPSHYSDVGRFWAASSGVTLPDGESFHGNEKDVRGLAFLYGRDVQKWDVLPKIILMG